MKKFPLSEEAQKTAEALRKALPPGEWKAVEPWLSTFFPYQLEWLLDPARFSVNVKSRQIGASHTYAGAAVLWGMLGETTSVVSKGEREGEEVVAKAVLHAQALERLGSKWAKPDKVGMGKLTLGSKGRIIALPATSGGRGYSGNMILDEFAYHSDPDSVFDGASGTVLHGYRMRIVSTPNGVGNKFHSIWTKPRKGWSKHATTLEQAIDQGLAVNLEECWDLAFGDQRIFDQLYRCSFLDNALQYIPDRLIESSLAPSCAVQGEYYAGLDIGRKADLTALVIVSVDAHGTRWVVHEETCKRTSFADLDRLVNTAVRGWGCRKVCIDETGMGVFPAEQLQAKYGLYRVIPVNFSLKSKEMLATTMYQHFADGRIRLPSGNVALRQDIASIQRLVTAAGNVTYSAPHTDEGHGDRAWALALALHGCSGPDHRRFEIFDYDPNA